MIYRYFWKIFHVTFVVYAHWFMSIRISQMKDHYIYLDQARYATYIVAKQLDNATVKASARFYKTTFPSDMIFTKYDTSNSDEQVEKFTREFSNNQRGQTGSLTYEFSTIKDLSFEVHKLAIVSGNPVNYTLKDW